MREQELVKAAFAARERAYTPYSGFAVGAALLAVDGSIYTGCNIENAAYSPTNCAERTAFFKAVSEGARDFCAIAIVGGRKEDVHDTGKVCAPCGVCLQVMMEFCDAQSFQVILARSAAQYEVHSLKELLPYGFNSANL